MKAGLNKCHKSGRSLSLSELSFTSFLEFIMFFFCVMEKCLESHFDLFDYKHGEWGFKCTKEQREAGQFIYSVC